jgi:hypothetical protein
MGRFSNIGKGRKQAASGAAGAKASAKTDAGRGRSGSPKAGAMPPAGRTRPGRPKGASSPGGKGATASSSSGVVSRLPGRKRRKGAVASPRERIQSAAAPLHDRRRRLVSARETTLRDLGGLMLEMYKRNRFREELLLDKCEEVLAIEVEIAHVDQRLFQLAPPNAAGMRPIGRCECGAPIHPGQNFCGVCGRPFSTLTQPRACARCGSGLRAGDQYCAKCGREAPDALQSIEAAAGPAGVGAPPTIDAAAIAGNAVAETMVIDAAAAPLDTSTPPLEDAPTSTDLPPVVPQPPTGIDLPPVAQAAEATSMPAPAPAPAMQPAALEHLPPPTGEFDWSAPPAAADAAIAAAIDAAPAGPTDAGAPFAGFPLTASIPPPPVVDPTQPGAPSQQAVSLPAPIDQPAQAPPPAATPVAAAPPPEAASAVPAAAPDPAPAELAVADEAPAPSTDSGPAPAPGGRAAKKAEAAVRKQRMKDAKARAKARAKAAREQRRRGGDG